MDNPSFTSIKGLNEIINLYIDIDSAINNFKEKTGLYCIDSCGKCCCVPSKKIEASILEVMPLVLDLRSALRHEKILEEIGRMDGESLCIFYSEEAIPGRSGRCTVYEKRPLVCRLFGHSAVVNKYGEKVIALCSEIKRSQPGCDIKINSMMNEGLAVPVLTEYAMRSSMIDPAISIERFPVNTAIKKAIEYLGLRNFYGKDL